MGETVRRWSLGVGCAGVLVVAFLPWARSGERERHSFDLLRSADRLDLIEGVPQRAAQVGWLLMPVAVGIVVYALASGHRRTAAFAALFTGDRRPSSEPWSRDRRSTRPHGRPFRSVWDSSSPSWR